MIRDEIEGLNRYFLRIFIRHVKIAKFALTGAINTLCDIAIYALLANILNIEPVLASLFSTGITLILSFFLNNHFVFKSEKRYRETALLFIALTLFNVWVIQSTVLFLCLKAINTTPFFSAHHWTANIVAKICGVAVSMVLNYIGYKRIFKENI